MKEKICGIYKITSPTNKIYIGQSVNILSRTKKYSILDCQSQSILYRSIKKYGWRNHKLEIIKRCSKEELDAYEKYYIGLYKSFDSEFGMNLQSGGKKSKFSEQTKKKMCLSNKGRIHTANARKNMSLSRVGMKFSSSHIENMKKARLGINNHTNKLSEQDVIDIFILSHIGVKAKILMKIYDVKHPTIYNIKNRKKWTHVTNRKELITSI